MISSLLFTVIPLSEFLKFDKIKSLSVDAEDLVQALSASQFLQLSPDVSAVCRRSSFVLKEEAELCTIYVVRRNWSSSADNSLSIVCCVTKLVAVYCAVL